MTKKLKVEASTGIINTAQKKEQGKISSVELKPASVRNEKSTVLKKKLTGAGMIGFSWTRGAQRDTEDYRNGYPVRADEKHHNFFLMIYLT